MAYFFTTTKKKKQTMYTFIITESDMKYHSFTAEDIGKSALVINGAIVLIGTEEKVNQMFYLLKKTMTH